MDHIKLSATPREVTGKAVKRLRKEGQIPVVVYGGPLKESLSLQVNGRELQRVLNTAGAARVIDLTVGGKSYPVLAREVQRHLTRLEITHVDFLAVRMDQPIQADVRVVLVGDTSALDANPDAILTQVGDHVTVEALPDRLPPVLEVDVSGLSELGQTISVGDLSVERGYTFISDPDTLLVSVAAPMRAPVEEVEAEGADEVELEGEEQDAGADAGDADDE